MESPAFRAHLQLTADAYEVNLPHLTGEYGKAYVEQALRQWAVKKLEAMLKGLREEVPAHGLQITADAMELRDLLHEARTRSCDYQAREGRDLFCSASFEGDAAPVVRQGLRVFAPTSVAVCRDCNLPAREMICSHLSHPRVCASALGGRVVKNAWCDEGHTREATEASLCSPGEHGCWERLIEVGPDSPPRPYVAPALSHALDFLGAVWRLKFGKRQRLIQPTRVTPIADLERDCSTREELQSRLSALADTFKLIRIDDQLLGDHPRKDQIRPEQSFKRLEAALENVLPSESLDRVKTAIRQLAAINDLRVTAQHSETSANRAVSLKTLGIADYPDASWKEMWDQVRSRAASALGTIATELNAVT
jgi:hypothetical protein